MWSVEERKVYDISNVIMNVKWTPDVKVINETPYIKIDKKDPALHKFITGEFKRSKDEWRGNMINVEFMDELAQGRTQACDNAIRELLRNDEENKDDRHKKKKIGERTKAQTKHNLLIPSVTVEVRGHNMKVLFGIKREPVFIELKMENLDYIINNVKSDIAAGKTGLKSKNED